MNRNGRLAVSYSFDWILTITFIVLFYLLDFVQGYWREFSLDNENIQYTFAEHERVPPWLLYVLALVAPFFIMGIYNLALIRSWWDFHCSSLGLLLGLSLTGALTQVAKVTVGRPRPDLIDRCQPILGAKNQPVFGLANASICTQVDNAVLKDGFRSFFSGHSSLSFAGLGFLSFYLAGKLHLFDHRGHAGKAWISMAPLMGAGLVAISRTMDNRHHWQDVLTGSVVGLVLSYFAYRQYFPTLTSTLAHKAYSPRIPRHKQQLAVDLEASGIPLENQNSQLYRDSSLEQPAL